MKLLIKSFTILFTAATMCACNNDDKTSTTETNTDSVSTDKSMADTSHGAMKTETASAEQEFLNYAVPKNTKEIMWLKAGMTMGTSKELKSHSTMMLKDHNDLAGKIKDYMAKNSKFTMPALDTANEVNINDKKGADWDKAWTDKMVDDHNEILGKLKSAQTDVKDADLNKIITGTIPVVESHLSMVKMMQDKMKK